MDWRDTNWQKTVKYCRGYLEKPLAENRNFYR